MDGIGKESIVKRVLHAGKEFKPFQPGCKVIFHFVTRLCNEDKTEIDDSRKIGKPMELVLGKQFKLEVWESIVQLMAVGEVSSYTVNKSDFNARLLEGNKLTTAARRAVSSLANAEFKQKVSSYPFVSKTLRDVGKPERSVRRSHCCGGSLQTEGIGYEDLNKLMENPQDLEFIIELLEVIPADGYDKESWQLTEDEKLKQVPKLREEGNVMYRNKSYSDASIAYAKAIGYLEQLMLKEKPKDTEWCKLNEQKIPLLLNYAQCKLLLKDYYAVIEHCTTVLESEPDNVKALFRRGKAHFFVWNVEEAKQDFEKVMKLDPSLTQTVKNLLKMLQEAVQAKNKEDKKILEGKIF